MSGFKAFNLHQNSKIWKYFNAVTCPEKIQLTKSNIVTSKESLQVKKDAKFKANFHVFFLFFFRIKNIKSLKIFPRIYLIYVQS